MAVTKAELTDDELSTIESALLFVIKVGEQAMQQSPNGLSVDTDFHELLINTAELYKRFKTL